MAMVMHLRLVEIRLLRTHRAAATQTAAIGVGIGG